MAGKHRRGVIAVVALSWITGACTETPPKEEGSAAVQRAALSEPHQVVGTDADAVPTFVTGAFGVVPAGESFQAEALRPVLAQVAPLFRLDPASLYLKKAYTGFDGDQHFRYGVRHHGIDVLGAELRLHARDGQVFAVNTNARGDLAAAPATAAIAPEAAVAAAREDRESPPGATVHGEPRLVYWRDGSALVLAYEVRVRGTGVDGTPVDDSVLVNARSGDVFLHLPHVHAALSRVVLSGNPPAPVRTEGQPPVGTPVVDTLYDHLGSVYQCYHGLFGRDSYNGAGAQLVAHVNTGLGFQYLSWDGLRLNVGATGTGIPVPPLDLTAHELTHGVTDSESDLIYSGESGALNESMSDIFGAVCEWYAKGQVVDADVWRLGEGGWIPQSAVRSLAAPASDGVSLDWYPDYTPGTDVHRGSGISNLAFYLLAQGGTHPRGKSTWVVQGIGMEKAARIFYKMNADLLLPFSNFDMARIASEQAAIQLGYGGVVSSTATMAWRTAGVVRFHPWPPEPELLKDIPITGLSGGRGNSIIFQAKVPEGVTDLTFTLSGGTGDADMYVRRSAYPTTTTYDCRPYKTGNEEQCVFPAPDVAEATWYVMVRGFSAYSGVSLMMTWRGGYARLEPGIRVSGLSGAPGSNSGFILHVPELPEGGGRNVHVQLQGGSGNADLYVRRALVPGHADYDCRGVNEHSTEVCNLNNVAPGRYYLQLYGAKGGYSDVSIRATYE
jgi:vibriolysin